MKVSGLKNKVVLTLELILKKVAPEGSTHVANAKALQALTEFKLVIDELYGTHTDISIGLLKYQSYLAETIKTAVAQGKSPSEIRMFYGRGSPSRSDAVYQHVVSFQTLLERVQPEGSHLLLLRRSLLVFAYARWEEEYRLKFATALGKSKSDIATETFGDLRTYRNAIVHNHAVLDRPVAAFRIAELGQSIDLGSDDFEDILAKLIEGLVEIANTYLGEQLDWRLGGPL